MTDNIIFIILACALGNYLLRVVPFFIPVSSNLPPYIKRFLDYMPLAALGALILPGIITSFPQNPAAGVAGVTAAAAVAWIYGGLMMPVIASIGASWFVLQYL